MIYTSGTTGKPKGAVRRAGRGPGATGSGKVLKRELRLPYWADRPTAV